MATTVTSFKKEMFPSDPSLTLLFLSCLFDVGATFILLRMPIGQIWSYGYFISFGVVNIFIYMKHGVIRAWMSNLTVEWWAGAGKGLGGSVMLPIAVFLSSIGEASVYCLGFQVFFYGQVFLYGVMLKPRTDFGLQAFSSRLPVLTAFRTFGIVWAVLLAMVMVCSTFLRHYLDTILDVGVEAGLHQAVVGVDGLGRASDDE